MSDGRTTRALKRTSKDVDTEEQTTGIEGKCNGTAKDGWKRQPTTGLLDTRERESAMASEQNNAKTTQTLTMINAAATSNTTMRGNKRIEEKAGKWQTF